MLTTARWLTLALAIVATCSWAVVSGLRVTYQGASFTEMMARGEPGRIADPIVYERPYSKRFYDSLRRADVALRLAAALLISVHLVILNLWRARS